MSLSTPLSLGNYSLPNRIVMAPMTRSRSDAQGNQSPLAADYYAARADAGLLITEGTDKIGFGGHKVVLLDITAATDVLTRVDASTVPLVYEKVTADFAALGITLGTTEVVADLLNDVPQILERKLEGITILNANEIVISSDNDFGIGDVLGATTKVYTIRLSAPIR